MECNLSYAETSCVIKEHLSMFISANYPIGGEPLLIDDQWYAVEDMLNFLDLFYLSIVSLFGACYPTSHLMMHAIIKIADYLNLFEIVDYWGNIPLLCSYAFILDPRAKLNGFTKTIQFMFVIFNRYYSTYYQHVKIELSILFSKYESKFAGVRLQRPPWPNHEAGKKVYSWNRISGSGSGVPAVPSPSPAPSAYALYVTSELTTYLDSDLVCQFYDSFNILSWWHNHKKPIMLNNNTTSRTRSLWRRWSTCT
jgi:hypothetical protein